MPTATLPPPTGIQIPGQPPVPGQQPGTIPVQGQPPGPPNTAAPPPPGGVPDSPPAGGPATTPPAGVGPDTPGATFTPGIGWHVPGGGGGGMGWGNGSFGGGFSQGGGAMPDLGGIHPANVADPGANWGNYNEFGDTVWNDFRRRFDPMREQSEARFNQDMLNRGIAQGSAAYTAARADFDRGLNDQTAAAQLAAQQATLGAQGQMWDQSYRESALANALAQSQMSLTGSMYGTDGSVAASRYGNDINRANFLDNLGFQGESRDFNEMMQLAGYGNGVTNYNNGLLGFDQGRAGVFNGMIPGVQPGQIDTQGAYNAQYAGQQANANAQNAANAAQQQQYMQLAAMAAAAFLSDENAKTIHGEADGEKSLEAVRSMPAKSWTYHGDTESHVGPTAQDFNMALHGEPRTTIAVQDAVGASLSAVQALDAKVSKLASQMARKAA